jgi:hypothetical protein
MKSRLVRASVLGALAFSMTFAAHAASLYNNLSATSNGSDSVSDFGPLADSFSTGGSPVVLTSVTLDLLAFNPDSGGSFTVTLYSDNSTSPGSALGMIGVFSDSVLTSSLADYTLTTDYALSADTRYWIELASADSDASSSVEWSWSYDTSGTGVAGEYFANQSGVNPNTSGPYQMDLETGTPTTPEPSTLFLLGSGLVMLADPLRRRLRAGRRG